MLLAACGSSDDGTGGQSAFINWARLRNPVLGFDDRSLKDVAVAYHPGRQEFYIYTSTRFELADPKNTSAVRSFYRTRDWRHFHAFDDADVNGAGYGPGSPDVSRIGIVWQMVYQVDSPAGGTARTLVASTSTNLRIPFEDWNPAMHANSAFLADWREHDGYFYLFYAGSLEGDSFELRGHGKIGVARSRDLVEWHVAGDERQ